MFTQGQMMFAIFFIVAFAAALIYSYRKDLKLHKLHYKNTAMIVGIVIVLAIIIFATIVFSMH
ncbi:hypothetical protein [Aureivirga sp. CE67]|uniref:hypothetical protein n=1 Tax=Aureivirga sp. CE67 TaxID=1788983 RepID=UPI0018CBACA9|nr:hypothetical protein [Aureivirga sp. CE67]